MYDLAPLIQVLSSQPTYKEWKVEHIMPGLSPAKPFPAYLQGMER